MASEPALFESVVVGIDGSTEALQACRQANRLRAPGSQLLAVSVAETFYAMHARLQAPAWVSRLRTAAAHAVAEIDDPHVQTEVVDGRAADVLLARIDSTSADLVAVGPGSGSRATGMLLGSVASRLIHEAPCSVLVARGDCEPARFPRTIVVGIDGSEPAAEADAVAQVVAASLGSTVRHVAATDNPVDALVEASREADLLIVGSRGLHGVASLGSVAERVAHGASCSVLIVRPHRGKPAPELPRIAEGQTDQSGQGRVDDPEHVI
jgi:nucleotide-binding universal stress UspA family protein